MFAKVIDNFLSFFQNIDETSTVGIGKKETKERVKIKYHTFFGQISVKMLKFNFDINKTYLWSFDIVL